MQEQSLTSIYPPSHFLAKLQEFVVDLLQLGSTLPNIVQRPIDSPSRRRALAISSNREDMPKHHLQGHTGRLRRNHFLQAEAR